MALLATLFFLLPAASLANDARASCPVAVDYGMSAGFNHTVAHAIHSMTVEALQLFNPSATASNGIPTVNRDTNVGGVVDDAPEVALPSDSAGFVTPTMKVINALFSNLGKGTDSYSDAWSPIERVVHDFHMRDLWQAVHDVYASRVLPHPPSDAVCACLLDIKRNGIRSAVQWVADQYKMWTPITLLGRPIPKLTGNTSWNVWRKRITHYYDEQSLFDAASYMYCAVGGSAGKGVLARRSGSPPIVGRQLVPSTPRRSPASANGAQCSSTLYQKAGLSSGFNHTVAHAIHSMTLEGLQLFHPQATARNGIPTVNRDTNVGGIVDDAPEVLVSDSGGFVTPTMKVINELFSNLGKGTDSYSDAWSPVERVVHDFHMRDLWHAVHDVYASRVVSHPPLESVCACLLDTEHNGIRAAVQWVADQYKMWTPITLLGRPIPKLTDEVSWSIWRDRITHYYDEQSLFDAATYMYCRAQANLDDFVV